MITLVIDWCLLCCLFCAFFVGQVGFCCNLDAARADGVFCELITWGRNVQQSCGSPKAALVWDVARCKCIKVWGGAPFVTLGLPFATLWGPPMSFCEAGAAL